LINNNRTIIVQKSSQLDFPSTEEKKSFLKKKNLFLTLTLTFTSAALVFSFASVLTAVRAFVSRLKKEEKSFFLKRNFSILASSVASMS